MSTRAEFNPRAFYVFAGFVAVMLLAAEMRVEALALFAAAAAIVIEMLVWRAIPASWFRWTTRRSR